MTKPDGADSVDRLAYNKYPTDEEIEKMNKSDRLAELLAAYGEYCYYDGDPKRGGTNLKDTAELVRQWISEGIDQETHLYANNSHVGRVRAALKRKFLK